MPLLEESKASEPVATASPSQQLQVIPKAKIERKPLSSLISVHDFEDAASLAYTEKAWAFYSSAATDLVSHQFNLQCHRQLMLRPRVLRNVSQVSIKRKILGQDSSAPFFISPAAMARLANPEGELAIARGCGNEEIIQIVSHRILGRYQKPRPALTASRSRAMLHILWLTSSQRARRINHSSSSSTSTPSAIRLKHC